MSLWEFIVHQLHNNQFFSAAVIAGPIAALTLSIRRFPFLVYGRIRRFLSLNVRFNSDQLIYAEAVTFLTERVIKERFTRNYIFSSTGIKRTTRLQGSDGLSYDQVIDTRLIEIGYGFHLGVYRNHLVFIYRRNVENSNTGSFKEYCTCTFMTRSRNLINQFMEDMVEFSEDKKKQEPGVKIKVNKSLDKWIDFPQLPLRPIGTIFLPNHAGRLIVDHLKKFDEKRPFNRQRGIPHRTGILLYGPPGTAKSSLIHAVASETGRDIFYLNLSVAKDLNDLLSGVVDWSRAMLVIEDIDAAGVDVNRQINQQDTGEEESVPKKPLRKAGLDRKVSLSELLNSLDGLMSPDGLVVVATTNYPDALDPALRRPGRFDLSLEIGFLGRAEFEGMAKLFDVDPSEYSLPYFEPMSGATLRQLLLENGVSAVEHWQSQRHQISENPSSIKE